MATATLKSASQNLDSKNPKKTLTLTPIPTNEQNLFNASKNPSSTDSKEEQAETELKLATVSSVDGTDQKELNDSKVKGTAVVSPTGDSGSANDIQKKLRRAERFGVPVQLSEEEKRNSRAERFGTGTGTVAGSEVSKTAEEQKRKARAERFGLSVPADDDAKKKARLARFGSDTKIDTVEEEKRKARAMRFSQPPSNNIPDTNHEEDVGQKTAIAGNATGGA